MSSITNLLRDINHTTPGASLVTFGTQTTFVSDTLLMNSDGIVKQTQGTAQMLNERAGTADWANVRGAGLLISPP